MKQRLLWQLFPSYLLIVLGSLALVGAYAAHTFRGFHRDVLATDLAARANLLAHRLGTLDAEDDGAAVQDLCREYGRLTAARFTVVLPSGRVVGDSMDDPAHMEPHHTRPEVRDALSGNAGLAARYSPTLGVDMLYVAVPILRDGETIGAARVALPQVAIRAHMAALRRRLLIAALIAAALAALLALAVSRRVAAPVAAMAETARRFAEGHLETRVRPEGPREIVRLAESLNRMAADLQARMNAVIEQRNEKEAVLASMAEGVIAVDTDERIRACNRAAAQWLGIEVDAAAGRPLAGTLRHSTLQDLLGRTLRLALPGECDLVLRAPRERAIQAHGTPLKDEHGRVTGALLVLTDVTRLQRLESLRRDFVANVSHELKTPITSIRAACETLLDDDTPAADGTRRFLEIIERQARRLEAIVEDLLSLSRIEHHTERDRMVRATGRLREPLDAALAACRVRAEARGVRLILDGPEDLEGPINAALLEQAVINLVDNAVTFSPEGGSVRIRAHRDGPRLSIRVSDDGPGIAPEHHARIFERFYCVDPGRSRTLGGTGLGLAIVKHIALAHSGAVRVESEPGRGSTFILELPGE